MIFWKMGCLVISSNSVELKSISSWPNFRAKTTKNHLCFHFHFKWLSALENRREREREGERKKRSRHHWHCTVCRHHRHCADRDCNRSFARSANHDLAFVCPDFMIFFGFCLCFEEWMILYTCLVIEKMWENVSNK